MPKEASVGILSRGILRIPFLEAFLGCRVMRAETGSADRLSAIAGWGMRATADRARLFAQRHGLPYLSLEDGFLRSYGTGDRFPPLSLVLDREGIYYDSTRPSDLESLLNSDADLLEGIADDVSRARDLILRYRLSKYNHAPEFDAERLRRNDRMRVLVIDQTAGDMSISLALAGADSFAEMYAAARQENPDATIYVKIHPEVVSGRKQGHFSNLADDSRTVVLHEAINPLSLIEQMDRVYCVSSNVGFEALLAGKPVTCFGMPWYAGWGATDDRRVCSRRTRSRTVTELFAAAYFHYIRYLNPVTRKRGTVFDVIEWLRLQHAMMNRYPGTIVGYGFRRWKAANVKPVLSLDSGTVRFFRDAQEGALPQSSGGDNLVVWGRTVPAGVEALSKQNGAGVLRMEDGFVRSVGLGSDLIPPLSLVLDRQGIYFDPSQPSDLENLLNTGLFTGDEIAEAERVRRFIVTYGITKYNIDERRQPTWQTGGRRVVFVPGQVEDDASILFGSRFVRTNMELLRKVRQALPEAFIVYKPHPDVLSGNRSGRVRSVEARGLADVIEPSLSAVSCIEAADEVHTMTSLTGFDALLRKKRVITYGEPFYAGWGLTEDMASDGVSFKRRGRRLKLDELVAGALLRYPLYRDPVLRGYTTCIAVLYRICDERNRLEANGNLEKLRAGYIRRQLRKLSILLNAMLTKA